MKLNDEQKKSVTLYCKKNKLKISEFKYVLSQVEKINLKNYNTNHSMGCYKQLFLGNLLVKNENNCKNYAKSCTWKPTYGHVLINFDLDIIKKLQNYEYKYVGYTDTFIEKTKDKIKKAIWIDKKGSKNHYKTYFTHGYITSDFHSQSFELCQQWRVLQVEKLLGQRKKELDLKKAKQKFVGLKHSLEVGNCKQGTINFSEKYNLDLDMGYTVDYLLSLEDSNYVRKLLYI